LAVQSEYCNVIEIHLFGDTLNAFDEESTPFTISPRLRVLLAALVLSRNKPIPKSKLSGMIWPESSENQARTNLRQSLYHFKQLPTSLSKACVTDRQHVLWRNPNHCKLDVSTFATLTSESLNAANSLKSRVESARSAVEIYENGLLVQHEEYWIVQSRQQYQTSLKSCLSSVISLCSLNNKQSTALELAEHLSNIEGCSEFAVKTKIELLVQLGRTVEAIDEYRKYRKDVENEDLGLISDELHHWFMATTGENYNRSFTHQSPDNKLIGRKSELDSLYRAVDSINSGQPHLYVISGEPGIGKSRLLEELESRVPSEFIKLKATCFDGEDEFGFAPINQLVSDPQFDSVIDQLDKRENEILASTLAIPPQAVSQPSTLSKHLLHQSLIKLFHQFSAPLLISIEDLQWCDDDTLQYLDYLLENSTNRTIAIVCTLRPGHQKKEYISRLFKKNIRKQHFTEKTLTDLELDDRLSFIRMNLDKDCRRKSEAEIRNIANQSGNPLHLELLVKCWSLSSQSGKLEAKDHSVHQHLMALFQEILSPVTSDAKDVLNIISAYKKPASISLLLTFTELTQQKLTNSLNQLIDCKVIKLDEQNRFSTRHAWFSDLNYSSMDTATVTSLHASIAHSLKSQYNQNTNSNIQRTGEIAFHLELAGSISDSKVWYLAGAKLAESKLAFKKARDWLRKAYELNKTTSDDMFSDFEADILLWDVHLITADKGMGNTEIDNHCGALQDLLPDVQSPLLRCRIINRLRIFNNALGQLDSARQFADAGVIEARNFGTSSQKIEALRSMVWIEFQLGNLKSAQNSLNQALDEIDRQIWRPDDDDNMATFSVSNCFLLGMLVNHMLGETALTEELAERYSQIDLHSLGPFTRSLNAHCAAQVANEIGDHQRIVDSRYELKLLAQRSGLKRLAGMYKLWNGVVLFEQSKPDKGLKNIAQSEKVFWDLAEPFFAVYSQMILARKLNDAQKLEDSKLVTSQALLSAKRYQQFVWIPHLESIHYSSSFL